MNTMKQKSRVRTGQPFGTSQENYVSYRIDTSGIVSNYIRRQTKQLIIYCHTRVNVSAWAAQQEVQFCCAIIYGFVTGIKQRIDCIPINWSNK